MYSIENHERIRNSYAHFEVPNANLQRPENVCDGWLTPTASFLIKNLRLRYVRSHWSRSLSSAVEVRYGNKNNENAKLSTIKHSSNNPGLPIYKTE